MLLAAVGLQRTTSPLSSHDLPVCLICLEPLTSTDFESGEAMSLECECRGDMGLRHKTCASKWVDVSACGVALNMDFSFSKDM